MFGLTDDRQATTSPKPSKTNPKIVLFPVVDCQLLNCQEVHEMLECLILEQQQ
jgi:hypothetical protein